MMAEISWLVFIPAALRLIIVPGQDMMLVMARSVAQGVGAGLATAAGVCTGLIGRSILATVGLGALLRASEWLFFAVKMLGAAYLVYLGITLACTRRQNLTLSTGSARSLLRLFFDGAFCNIANPKIVVFYLAFLPQFVLPGASHPALCVFVLGLVYAGLAFLVKGPVAIAGGFLSQWLRARPGALGWVYRFSGAVLMALAVKLALEQQSA